MSFQYYQGNPVIPYNGPDFRDPQVFLARTDRRWVMVVTKPIGRSIEIFLRKPEGLDAGKHFQ
ncbi:MAG: hypothetical protein IPL27_26720 [Lewinellaceae bacterium]|nr:hypothetical protein [Lewinellaceae bacterium]